MAVFCSSLTSWFPGMLLRYFLNDFEIVPVAPIITGITFGFTFHMLCISIVRSLYFGIFSVSFLITFLSPEIATSINILVPFSLARIIMSGLLGIIIIINYIVLWHLTNRHFSHSCGMISVCRKKSFLDRQHFSLSVEKGHNFLLVQCRCFTRWQPIFSWNLKLQVLVR